MMPAVSFSEARLPGQYFDSETNLHYNYFRDYDPATGRYIESDPIGLVAGPNTYGYASQNPIMYYDPRGLWLWPLIPVISEWTTWGSVAGSTGYISGQLYEAYQAKKLLEVALDRAREALEECLKKKAKCESVNCDIEESVVDELRDTLDDLALQIIPLMIDLHRAGIDAGTN